MAATIAVIGLSTAVVIVANDTNQVSKGGAASSVQSLRYGGFNPATGQPQSAPLPRQQPLAVKDYSMNSATGNAGGEPAQKSDTAQQSQNGPGARTR